MTTEPELSNIDLESGIHRQNRRSGNNVTHQFRIYSGRDSEPESEDEKDDQSVCFSDPEEEDDAESTYSSSHSIFYSTTGGSFDAGSNSFLGRRMSSASDSDMSVTVEEEDDGCGSEGCSEFKDGKVGERDCRICHLSLVGDRNDEVEDEEEEGSTTTVGGVPIELGCNCKGDLGVAHKHCAEAWFKIKGNKICEICNCTAKNVTTGTVVNGSTTTQNPNVNGNSAAATATGTEDSSTAAANNTNSAAAATDTQQQRFWQGHRFLNFLLACVVFAFVISWLFHFKLPSN